MELGKTPCRSCYGNYVMKQMTKYGHVAPLKPQHCPYLPNPIKYGKNNQAPSPINDSPLLDAAGKKQVQKVVGSFLYHAQAVDPHHNKEPQWRTQ